MHSPFLGTHPLLWLFLALGTAVTRAGSAPARARRGKLPPSLPFSTEKETNPASDRQKKRKKKLKLGISGAGWADAGGLVPGCGAP